MTVRPSDMNRFEFVRLAALRTAQLMRGCNPRVPVSYKLTTTARREVASGEVFGLPREEREIEIGPRHPAVERIAGRR